MGGDTPVDWNEEFARRLRVAEREVERLRRQCGCGWIDDKTQMECADHAAQSAENRRLRGNLLRYGLHDSNCRFLHEGCSVCDCGLLRALEGNN